MKDKLPLLEVRGEVYMPKSSFAELVRLQEEEGQKPFKNPRNAAAGSLRQKDASVTASRNLDIFIFNIQQIEGKQLDTDTQSLDYLREQGFPVVPTYRKFRKIEDALDEIDRIGGERDSLEFCIDGAVVKVDGFSQRETLGS